MKELDAMTLSFPSLQPPQGELESRLGSVDLRGKLIGDLHFDRARNAPVLIIGHHILGGKVVQVERPIVAMQRRRGKRVRPK